MGKAEIPAAPIMGLIFFLRKRFKNFAKSTPPAVSKMNATRPRRRMSIVLNVRNFSAFIWEAIVIPRKMVMRFASTF